MRSSDLAEADKGQTEYYEALVLYIGTYLVTNATGEAG
jgi:hypothetical protein